ncbi:MAG: YicC family protein [Desulfovibrionaceae bacterium]|nr:YicC family protein [Desulfovibrionaceae bacterium]
MLRSMTGFGRSVREDAEWTQTWEIRSVNGRFLDLKWRIPSAVRGLESRFERIVRSTASRGRVEISLTLQQRDNGTSVMLDEAQASAMLDAAEALAAQRGDRFVPDYSALLNMPSLWIRSDDTAEDMEDILSAGLAAALDDWNESRSTEGAALAKDMGLRISQLEKWVEHILERAPQIKEERLEQLKERLNQGLEDISHGLVQAVDENRFLQEMVILADKLDVSEELIRLQAHLDRMRELLNAGADAGRKLDFTLQECFREINTCGNKIQDSLISRLVVDFKNELEKCREQVQNLE